MSYIVLAYSIIQSMIMEYRDSARDFGRRLISSLDSAADVIPIQSYRILSNAYDAEYCFGERSDTEYYERDQNMLQNSLSDAIWNSHGGDDKQLFDVKPNIKTKLYGNSIFFYKKI